MRYFYHFVLIDTSFLSNNTGVQCEKSFDSLYLFFMIRNIQSDNVYLIILLVWIKVALKIEIISKILSVLSVIYSIAPLWLFWFMILMELSLQKRNFNSLIWCTSVFWYLYYTRCKLRRKCKIRVIHLFLFAQKKFSLFKIQLWLLPMYNCKK